LGNYPEVSLEAARSLANAHLDSANKGVSPLVRLEAAATAGGLTVTGLAEQFLVDYVAMKRLRAAWRYECALRVHVIPNIGDILADALTRDQVRTLIKKVLIRVPGDRTPTKRPRGGQEAARTVVSVMRKLYNWAIREELLKRADNPIAYMMDNLPKKRRRDRVLSLEEAKVVWAAASSLGYPFGPVYQLILLTGCRPGEWSVSRWPWIDFKQSLAVIPAEAYKTDHVHVVPLVQQATSILTLVGQEHRRQRGDFIFSGTGGEKALAGWPKAQRRMMSAICALTGDRDMPRWSPHDLRRTVATRLAEQLGVAGEQTIKRVLGHSDHGVTAIYNRYGYVKEMRSALEAWAQDLCSVEFSGPVEKATIRPGVSATFG
jgi:integrase